MPFLDFGVLFVIGLGVFGGILGAWLFQRLRIPQVLGYIAIGLLIGESGLRIVKIADVEALRSLSLFALGIIGFLVGGELKGENFRKYGRQFAAIFLGEGLAAFALVGLGVGTLVYYVSHNAGASLASGIVFGAIASATDPASTIDVLWEYRSRGVLTTSLIAIVALDDALAMTLYGLGTSLAAILTHESVSLGGAATMIVVELLGAVAVGLAGGAILNYILRWSHQRERSLAIAIGVILLVIGFALAAGMDVILATMTLGVTMVNLAPRRSKDLISLVRSRQDFRGLLRREYLPGRRIRAEVRRPRPLRPGWGRSRAVDYGDPAPWRDNDHAYHGSGRYGDLRCDCHDADCADHRAARREDGGPSRRRDRTQCHRR
jgi:NhaP-type Na+/H+ or K+/H+ antiporter